MKNVNEHKAFKVKFSLNRQVAFATSAISAHPPTTPNNTIAVFHHSEPSKNSRNAKNGTNSNTLHRGNGLARKKLPSINQKSDRAIP